ncbi:hypothetical protein F4806DRAFT_505357 [Annulohypoxylon nitens]|nr:hypothetical protein F4806DRAFT_505357 [Annulohypoxylon nitens]
MPNCGKKEMEANLAFLQWNDLYDVEKPFQIFINIPGYAEDKRSTNLSWEVKSKVIRDIRGLEVPPTLNDYGFKFLHRPSRLSDFSSKEKIASVYLPEVEEIIKAELRDVEKVCIFDWRMRQTEPVKEDNLMDLNNPMNWLLPAEQAHVDQSPLAVLRRVRLQFPDDAERLLKGRVRIINVWRPIERIVTDWPLALCDGRTIRDSDLIECDHIRRHYIGSTMYLLDNPEHRWYYMSNQSPEEIMIFKNFDSSKCVGACCAPHAAFKYDPRGMNKGRRSSIEVRALVFSPLLEEVGSDARVAET